jgi:hypothetical protein
VEGKGHGVLELPRVAANKHEKPPAVSGLLQTQHLQNVTAVSSPVTATATARNCVRRITGSNKETADRADYVMDNDEKVLKELGKTESATVVTLMISPGKKETSENEIRREVRSTFSRSYSQPLTASLVLATEKRKLECDMSLRPHFAGGLLSCPDDVSARLLRCRRRNFDH